MRETHEYDDEISPGPPANKPARSGSLPIWAWLVGAFLSGLLIYTSAMMMSAQGRYERANDALQQALKDKETAQNALAAERRRTERTEAEAAPAPDAGAAPKTPPERVGEPAPAGPDVSELRAQLESAREQRDAARREHQQAKTEVGALGAKVSELEAEAAKLREATSKLQADLDAAGARLNRSQAEARRYRARANRLEAELQERF